jgi:cell division protein ZapA
MDESNEIPAQNQSISVEIYDQVYHLRGIDPAYIQHLAHLVDSKMKAVSAHGGTVDSLRVAVLASLNIADELECLRERYNELAGSINQSQSTMRSRSASLSGMLDEVFDEIETPVRRAG